MLRTTKQTSASADSVTVAFVIRQDQSDRLAEMAKADDRSASSVIRLILDDYFSRSDELAKQAKNANPAKVAA